MSTLGEIGFGRPGEGGGRGLREIVAGASTGILVLVGLALAVLAAVLGLAVATFLNSEKIQRDHCYTDCKLERSTDASLDDRCAPCAQANEQRKFNDFVLWQLKRQAQYFGALSFVGGRSMYQAMDWPSSVNPLFPGAYQEMWEPIRDRAQELNLELLDPYDADVIRYMYSRKNFFGWEQNQTAEVEICEKRAEGWIMANSALIPIALFVGNPITAPPTKYSAAGSVWLDEAMFNYYVDDLERYISAVNARTQGNWWLALYNWLQSNGDILRAAWVNNHVSAINFELSIANPAVFPQPIKVLVAQRGFTMSPAQDARLTDVLTRYYAAQLAFRSYTLSVTPPLVNTISFNTWVLNYGWAACFGYTNGLWRYNISTADAIQWFQDQRTRAETIAATYLIERDALWPADAWMPWQSTWMHYLFPEGQTNGMGISGWGFNASECVPDPTTGVIPFQRTLDKTAFRYYGNIWRLQTAFASPPVRFEATNTYGCGPFAGNAAALPPGSPMTARYAVPPSVGYQNPFLTKNATYSIFIHEHKHHDQSSTVPAAACPTCWGQFAAVSAPIPIMTGVIPYGISAFSIRTPIEGYAVFTELQSARVGMMNRHEQFHAGLLEQDSRYMAVVAVLGVRLGIWTPTDALNWYNQYAWLPPSPSFNTATIFQNAIREMSGSTAAYGLGLQIANQWEARARAQCADFDLRSFSTVSHSRAPGPIEMWNHVYQDYVDANCVARTTHFGDCGRTVVAPKLRAEL